MDVGVGCMRYFGIRSYLDNFYDRRNNQEIRRVGLNKFGVSLNQPRFSSRWWKIILWFGSILVLMGFFLLLVGLILPRKQVNVNDSSVKSNMILVDRQALAYNSKLDTSHLLGVCLVVAGGILFTVSLLMPTFFHMWCASGETNDETDPLRIKMELSNNEQVLPVRSIPKSIQPTSSTDTRMTTDGLVPIVAN